MANSFKFHQTEPYWSLARKAWRVDFTAQIGDLTIQIPTLLDKAIAEDDRHIEAQKEFIEVVEKLLSDAQNTFDRTD